VLGQALVDAGVQVRRDASEAGDDRHRGRVEVRACGRPLDTHPVHMVSSKVILKFRYIVSTFRHRCRRSLRMLGGV
jgi:hypothetical protein